MARSNQKGPGRRTGLILVVLLLLLLPNGEILLPNGEIDPAIVIGLSVALILWSLFMAPAWCGAAIRRRGEFCRNNSWGLLLGCHIREHRLQKFKLIFVQRRWAQFTRGLFSGPSAVLATVSGMIGTVASVVTFIGWARPG